MKKLFLLCTFVSLVTLGCGGGSGGVSKVDGGNDDTAGKTIAISGLVTDPAIKNARVEIRRLFDDKIADFCGARSNQNCNNVWSAENGYFRVAVPKDFNFSDYYLLTFGGIDTETGVNFESISLQSPLTFFSNNSSNVVISPVTSLLAELMSNGDSAEVAADKTRAALNLPADVNPLGDPAESVELLKASYLLTQIAVQHTALGGSDTFSNLETSLAGQALFDTNGSLNTVAINSLFENLSTPTERDKATQFLVATTDRITAINGDVGSIIESIINAEKLAALQDTLSEILIGYPTPGSESAEYSRNVQLLYNKVESLVGTFSSDRFAIEQMVKFVLISNDFFADYNNYQDTNTFSTNLESIVPAEQMAAFVESLKFIANESVYAVNVPLGIPLGMDNQKRVDYYFNSNIDVNFKARTLIGKVYNDEINDKIYLAVIASYSKYGFVDISEKLASAYVIQALNRANAYRTIAKNTAVYNPTRAAAPLETSKKILMEIYDTSGGNNNLAAAFLQVANTYQELGDRLSSQSLREWLMSELVGKLSPTTNPTRYNVHARIISGQNELAAELSLGDNEALAIDAVDYLVQITDTLEPLVGNNPYSTQILNYVNAIGHYKTIYGDSRKAEAKAKILPIYEKIEKLRILTPAAGVVWKGNAYYATLAGHLYWLGESALAEHTLELVKSNEASYRFAARLVAGEMAKTNFDSAVSFYESKIPVKTDFGNVVVQYGYIDTFAYFTVVSKGGIGLDAIDSGNIALAEQSIDYLKNILDDATEYFRNNKQWKLGNTVSYEFNTVWTSVMANTNSRYNTEGYTKIADLYYKLGKNEKAENTLRSAELHTDSSPDSIMKSKSYSTIAYLYYKNGNITASENLFEKASSVNIDDTDHHTAEHYRGIARDMIVLGNKEKAINNLEVASTYAEKIHTQGTANDNNAQSEVRIFYSIAQQYGELSEIDKAFNVLELAEQAALQINSASNKTSRINDILKVYAELGFADIAYQKAESLHTLLNDRNNAISEIATNVTSINHFAGSEIAFIDTDRDGKPDFFVPWATTQQISESGLELDDDIDGDGKLDINDLTPFYAD